MGGRPLEVAEFSDDDVPLTPPVLRRTTRRPYIPTAQSLLTDGWERNFQMVGRAGTRPLLAPDQYVIHPVLYRHLNPEGSALLAESKERASEGEFDNFGAEMLDGTFTREFSGMVSGRRTEFNQLLSCTKREGAQSRPFVSDPIRFYNMPRTGMGWVLTIRGNLFALQFRELFDLRSAVHALQS